MGKYLRLSMLLMAVLCSVALPAQAEQNRVQFGDNIHVPALGSVRDAVCFFCTIDAEGAIEGNAVVFFGGVRVHGRARHDVVAFFSNVQVDDEASVGNNMITFFSDVRLGREVTIGHDRVAMFCNLKEDPTVLVRHNSVVQPIWLLLAPLAILFGLVYGLVRIFRRGRHTDWRAH